MSETRNGVMSRCEPCGGNGYHSGYGGKDRCEDCLGTGRELTLREREIVLGFAGEDSYAVYSAHEVDAARAAVDARHAEEIAAKDRRERDLENALVRQEHLKDLAEAENTTLREQLAAVQQERDEKAAMHSELATLAGSAIVLATLDTLAGERPTQEPEHSLPAAVWRLVQERDEARAANTANLREMAGMAGRFRQTLQTVRACIVALTPGHRTGYDWNADPLYLTRKEGEALSAIDAALSSSWSVTEMPRTIPGRVFNLGIQERRSCESVVSAIGALSEQPSHRLFGAAGC